MYVGMYCIPCEQSDRLVRQLLHSNFKDAFIKCCQNLKIINLNNSRGSFNCMCVCRVCVFVVCLSRGLFVVCLSCRVFVVFLPCRVFVMCSSCVCRVFVVCLSCVCRVRVASGLVCIPLG